MRARQPEGKDLCKKGRAGRTSRYATFTRGLLGEGTAEAAEKGARSEFLAASHTRRGRGESPSTLVTPAQNTGARNIHDRIVHGRGGRAEDRARLDCANLVFVICATKRNAL